ncbi:nitroreductase/quinone reductase family protein [Nocardia amamiensis]|uniref:nitroreductase/quinone reductase family protein n=1 Tax=Nocardia amamiensis TaxID=404578 RepID=UPI000A048F45|nr:nitroreductase/quinone reductase family protein [Nocardia amamiensis]
MAFEGKRGTHGRRNQSAGPVTRWLSKRMMNWHRRKGGKFQGMDVLVLTTKGAKTGQERQTALSWFPDGEDAWLIVASAAGARGNPAWFHNIAAHPDQVWAEFPGRTIRVVPAQLTGAARAAAWERITAAQPRYAKYQQATDRVLPVVRLVPAEEG